MIGLMVDMLMVFFPCGELVFVLSGVGPILRNGVEFRDKVMLHCSRKMKFQQGFYYLFFQLKPSLLRLRNLKKVFQQTSLLKNNKDSLDILLDRSLFHIPVFKLSLLQFSFLTIICVIHIATKTILFEMRTTHKGFLCHRSFSTQVDLIFPLFPELVESFFCIVYLALVKPGQQLGTQHLRPLIEIHQYIKYFCHKQCKYIVLAHLTL